MYTRIFYVGVLTDLNHILMDVRNRLFYASTFVDNNAAGLLPASAAGMGTLVDAMTEACYGDVYQPDRCAILSQMVGRIRTQDARQAVSAYSSGRSAASPSLAITTSSLSVSPATLASAIVSLGATEATTSLAVC